MPPKPSMTSVGISVWFNALNLPERKLLLLAARVSLLVDSDSFARELSMTPEAIKRFSERLGGMVDLEQLVNVAEKIVTAHQEPEIEQAQLIDVIDTAVEVIRYSEGRKELTRELHVMTLDHAERAWESIIEGKMAGHARHDQRTPSDAFPYIRRTYLSYEGTVHFEIIMRQSMDADFDVSTV